MQVYLKSKSGKWLMPTHPAKARVLLKEGKAEVIQRTPFAIQLLYETTEYVQPVKVGVDDGGIRVGIAAVCNAKVLYQEEVKLRTDIKSLMDTRRGYRRGRRQRNTGYREPRWQNRKHSIPICKVCEGNAPKGNVICRACLRKVDGKHQEYAHIKKTTFRLPPSIKSKKDAIIQTIKQIPLPISEIRLEDAYFDLQAMENPDITAEEYQFGEKSYRQNYRVACFTRDGHKCRVCESAENLQAHHIVHRANGGSDKLSNLMTLCEKCHDKYHKVGIELPEQKNESFLSLAHVQQGKNYLQHELSKIAPLKTTFGYLTSYYRNNTDLEKTHLNDAVMIANPDAQPNPNYIKTRCVRSRKRSLHEANPRKGRKEPNRTQKRNNKNTFSVKGFRRWSTVKFAGRIGFISGFSGKYSCRIVDINGDFIKRKDKGYTTVPLSCVNLIHHNQGRVSTLLRDNPCLPRRKSINVDVGVPTLVQLELF